MPALKLLSPQRIALLAGGNSAERDVSLQSGAAISRALLERGHSVTQIDPANVDVRGVDWSHFDIAAIALHGTFGEDGQIQEILSSANLPYTGSDARVSRLAFSKSASKERCIQAGLPTPDYVLVHSGDPLRRIARLAKALGYPLAVKPDAQGSSVGVSIIADPQELPTALECCFQHGRFGLLEAAIIGTEWTVGLIDDFILPVIQIETARPFYDYRAKYEDNETRYRFDFDVPAGVVAEIQSIGRRTAAALGTRGIARVDLRLDQFLRPWVLEVNTIPGMTDHSLIPKAAARVGMDFGELCERMLLSALRCDAAHSAPAAA